MWGFHGCEVRGYKGDAVSYRNTTRRHIPEDHD
jgi:hypothetical protein